MSDAAGVHAEEKRRLRMDNVQFQRGNDFLNARRKGNRQHIVPLHDGIKGGKAKDAGALIMVARIAGRENVNRVARLFQLGNEGLNGRADAVD